MSKWFWIGMLVGQFIGLINALTAIIFTGWYMRRELKKYAEQKTL